MPDNDELQFQLTDADRESLKNNSTYSLPDNPSDKEFSAAQIKKAMYYPSLMLFDWMKEGFDEYNEKFEEYDEKFDKKVDKIESVKIIYGTDATKANIGIQYSVDALADNIVQRNNLGEVNVPASTTNDYAAISRLQFRLEIARLDDEDVKKAGSTMSGNLKFNNGFGLYDRNNKILISQLNDVNTVGNADSSLELKGNSIKTIDKTLQKYNSTTGTSENYALIGDVNNEKARAMAAENDIRDIASGKSKSISISIVDNPDFDSEALELSYIGTIKDVDGVVYNQSQLKKGDEILVVETGKKDRWFGGTGKFYVLESDTSFLVNYQKKLFPDDTITLDSLGNIKANLLFSKIAGNVSDNAALTAAFNVKQDKATSYNMNTDSTKTVFYQNTAPVHAPTGALWINQSAGVVITFSNINGSIADNLISDAYIKNLIKTSTDRNVISTIETISSGDVVQLKYLNVNLWTQSASYNTMNLPLANPTTAGLMSYEDYNTLIANTQKIAQLEGRLKRISYDAKDNPTANEIDAYVRGLGYTVDDFQYLKVIVYGTKHMWLYYTRPTARWQDDGIDAAGIFTNSVAGLIKGSAVAGKVYAESDGTGSVYGWDDLNNTVTSHGTAISNIQSDLPNYIQKTGGTFTGNINMGGHLINMVGGRIANVGVGGDDDAVPKKWITGQLANYIPTSGGTINGDLSITGTLTIGTFRLSGSLDANNNKIINLANPVNATDGANKDYVDLAIDDLDDLISDEVEARTNADNLIMLTKTADPTTTDVGALGQLWKNTTNGKVFKCDSISGSTYSWSELGTGSFETDNSSIIKGSDGKYKVSYGGKYIESRGLFINDFTAGTAEDDNIYNIESAGAVAISKIQDGDRIVGTYAIGATEYEVDQVAHELTVTGVNTGTTYTGIGFTLFYDAVSGENVYILFVNNSQYMLAKETDDVSSLLTDITSLQLKVLTIDSEYIRPEVLPLSNAFYHITTTGVITPILDTLINRTSTNAPTTKAVGEAIKTITDLISSSASSSNKLLSASEIDQKIALVEARQIYKTASQGSFETKAQLTSATTFYDASGTSVTPTENDVAYVLADEDHSNKTAKYTVASVVGTTVTWAFVIAFTDLQLTQAQQDAINSGITSAKVQIIDNLTTNFLRTDGSNSMSGTINSSAYVAISGTNVNAYTAMQCGTDGGRMVLYGSGYESNSGGFAILAVGPATNCALQGYLDGTLKWNDKDVITSAGGEITGNLTLIGNLISGTDACVVRSDNSHEVWLIGGTNYQNGSSFRASGKDSSMAGKFQCIARNGTATKTLEGSPDGTFKWDGSNVLTEATGYTQSQVNTKLTNGSVTKVGTATKGSATQPIYLNAGVPTVCNAYSLGTWNNVAFSGSSGVVLAPASGFTFSTASGHNNKYRQDTLGRIEVSLRTTITTSNSIAANSFLQIGTLNKKNGSMDVWTVASVLVGGKYYALPFHITDGGAVYLSNTTSSALSLSGAQLQVTFFTA